MSKGFYDLPKKKKTLSTVFSSKITKVTLYGNREISLSKSDFILNR